jgi:hypothetical protein
MSSVRKGWVQGLLAGALALVVTAPGTTLAQTSTGTVRGHVLDENGQPLTAASVQATSTATNSRRGMLTEEGGFYNLGGLRPGDYVLEFSHPSYGAQTQNARVQIGQTLTVDVVLFPDAIEVAGITAVIEQERIIEATTPEVATNITRAQIENLPLLDRNFLDFATLAPGVRRTADGQGITAGGLPSENVNLFIDGASFKNDILRNGVVGQDASPGNPFPQNAVQEFRVITQNYKAEFQKAAGAVITATTKSGTNDWQGSAFFLGQNEKLISETVFDRCDAPLQDENCVPRDVGDIGREQFGGTVGGPLVRDLAFVFGSYEGNYRDIPRNINTVNDSVLGTLPDDVAAEIGAIEGTSSNQDLESDLFFGKFTYEPGERHNLEASLNVRDEREIRGFGNFDALSRAEEFNNDVFTVIGKWQYSLDRLLNEAHVDWQRFHWEPIPLNPDEVGRVYETVLAVGGKSTGQDFEQDRLEFTDDLTYTLPDWGGSHVLKGGAYVSFANYDASNALFGNPEFRFRQAESFEFPFEASLGVGDPRIEQDNAQYGFYAQDDWSPTDRLILNFGIRWDVETNMLNNDWVTPDSVIEDVAPFLSDEQEARYFTDGDDRDPFYGAVQPRVGFTYDLTGNQVTTLFGGVGIFYDRTAFNFGLDERSRLLFPVFRFRFSEDGLPDNGNPTIAWEDRFLSRQALLDILESGNPAGKPEVFLLENDTEPPMAKQVTIGVRQAVGPLMLSANYTGVRGENVFTNVFGNRRPDGSLQETPRFRNILLSTDEGKTWYDALLFQVGKPFTVESGWGAQVSYTLAEAEENTTGQFTLDVFGPEDFERFPAGGDSRHNLTANWIVGIPWDIRFSGIATFRSATPIHARVGNDPNNNGIGGDDFVNDEGPNSRRPEDGEFSEVNVRFEKGFTLANHRIAVLAEIFNLFDNENYRFFNDNFGNFNRETGEIEENPNYGQPTGLFDDNQSRRLQLGARYEF